MEQPLPPNGSCLLGSVNLTKFVEDPFTKDAFFNFHEFEEVVATLTRMLDNVVEINGLPLKEQREELIRKRRHGMGYLGLGSTLSLLGVEYGSEESLKFTDIVTKTLALIGWEVGVELAKEKGPAPIFEEDFLITEELIRKRPELTKTYILGEKVKGKVLLARYSNYMEKIEKVDSELVANIARYGCRFTHHSSIAPTGTLSLSLGNNVSNGIEPTFAHLYSRNIIREGKKSKEKVDVCSYELSAYRHHYSNANATGEDLPKNCSTTEEVSVKEHVDIQAAAQYWIDSSISKTINIPTDFDYEEFKDIYMYAYEKGLKGCTTFRFNPEAFQGVLIKNDDLKNTKYEFTMEDGTTLTAQGDQEIMYEGEMHTAANLFDALKENYYGKF